MAWDLGTIKASLKLDVANWNTNLSTAAENLSSITSTNDNKLIALGSTITKVGNNIDNNLSKPIRNFGLSAIETSRGFETAMARVQAISQSTDEDLARLTAVAREMGATTVYSASEAADGLYYMALAGWSANESIDAIESVLKLAAVAELDLGTASDIVTDAMTAFGLSADQAGHFADVLAQSAANSNTTVAQLGEAFQYIAPVAGEFGFTIEDAALALGLFANQGIKSGQAGTTLRGILARLVDPTDDVRATMKALEIELFNTDGSMKSLREIIDVLRSGFNDLSEEQLANIYITEDVIDALDELEISLYDDNEELKDLIEIAELADIALEGLTDQTREQYLATLGGIRGLTGLSAILNVTEEDLEALTLALDNADGSLEDMYGIITNTTDGALKELTSAYEELQLVIGDVLLPVLTSLIRGLTEVVRWFSDLPGPIQKVIIVLGTIVAVIGPIVSIVGKLVKAVGVLQAVFSAIVPVINIVVGALSAPITVIALVVAAIVTLYTKCEWFRDGVNAIFSAIGQFISDAWQAITDWFSDIGEAIGNFVESATETISEWVDNVVVFFTETLPDAISNIIEWFTELPGKIWDAIVGAFEKIVEWGMGVQERFNEWILKTIASVIQWLKELPGKIWDAIKSAIDRVATWGSNLYNKFKEWVTKTISAVVDWLKQLPGKIWDAIKSAVTKVATWGNNLKDEAKKGAKKMFDAVVDGIKKLPEKIASIGTDVVKGLWNGIKSVKDWILDKISGFVDNILGGIKSFFGINSPSRETFADGEMVGYGLGNGIVSTIGRVLKDVDKFADAVKDELDDEFNQGADVNLIDSFDEQINATPVFADTLITAFDTFITDMNLLAERFEGFTTTYDYENMLGNTPTMGEPYGVKNGEVTNITIENITVRDDNDLDQLSRGLYDRNARAQRANGLRGVGT